MEQGAGQGNGWRNGDEGAENWGRKFWANHHRWPTAPDVWEYIARRYPNWEQQLAEHDSSAVHGAKVIVRTGANRQGGYGSSVRQATVVEPLQAAGLEYLAGIGRPHM